MVPTRLTIFLILVIWIVPEIGCTPLYADSGQKQSKTFVPTIIAVGEDSITVQKGRHPGVHVKDQDPVNVATYKITSFTDIEVNGLKGTIADLSPGMEVRVDIGMDNDVAENIVARGQGPALPTPSPTPKGKAAGTAVPGAMTFYKPFRKITGDVVMAVSSDRITIAPTGGKAIAYQITPSTEVRVNGKKADIGDVSVGMTVTVAASGEGTAGRIDANDAPDPAAGQ